MMQRCKGAKMHRGSINARASAAVTVNPAPYHMAMLGNSTVSKLSSGYDGYEHI